MHHNCLCLCKARTAQQNSRLPVPNAKLDQYQAHIPDSLKNIPKALPSSTPGGDVAKSLITPSWGINALSSSPNETPNGSPSNQYIGGTPIIQPSIMGSHNPAPKRNTT